MSEETPKCLRAGAYNSVTPRKGGGGLSSEAGLVGGKTRRGGRLEGEETWRGELRKRLKGGRLGGYVDSQGGEDSEESERGGELVVGLGGGNLEEGDF
jgi:hypothetical protein